MKRVLAIMGSPRVKGNTDILLDSFLEGVKTKNCQINKIYLRDLNILHCKGCYYCGKLGQCSLRDDMTEIYDEFDNSDGIIIATPLYFNTVSSLTKTMIDRCQVYWTSKYILKSPAIKIDKKRVGVFICNGGAPHKKGQFEACMPVIDLFFKAINTEYKYNYFVSGTDVRPVWERKEIIDEVFILGTKLFE